MRHRRQGQAVLHSDPLHIHHRHLELHLGPIQHVVAGDVQDGKAADHLVGVGRSIAQNRVQALDVGSVGRKRCPIDPDLEGGGGVVRVSQGSRITRDQAGRANRSQEVPASLRPLDHVDVVPIGHVLPFPLPGAQHGLRSRWSRVFFGGRADASQKGQ